MEYKVPGESIASLRNSQPGSVERSTSDISIHMEIKKVSEVIFFGRCVDGELCPDTTE